ncbi:MAG: sulfite exporter TauE/SafE family protein [Pseudomonadota bacterium]|nr:sulfite exporter TauE/SafE family protein [Pseudomonadota bacterium]|tara:strand:+ start:37 stop:777 length:741 start_codon:yes stop_codon:yes gene_type:complete
MIESVDILICICLFFGAILYTSVGHAGASIYIAIMSIFGVPVTTIKPTALSLNIIVSSYTSYQFIRAKYYDIKLAIPLLIGAIPAAFIGGYINLPSDIYKPIVGVMLLYSAYRFITVKKEDEKPTVQYKFFYAVSTGIIIGFLAGLTGTGGGIFLSPLIILAAWTTTKGASGTVAIFIFFNSLFGLMGNITSLAAIPPTLPLYGGAALFGGIIGSRIGIHYFQHTAIKRTLGLVLLIAGLKLIFNI